MTTSREGRRSFESPFMESATTLMASPGSWRTHSMHSGLALSRVRPVSMLQRSWHQRWHLWHRRRPLV